MPAYCLRRGQPLHAVYSDGRQRLICDQCGWIYFPQLKVSAAALIQQDGRLLLLCRQHDPWKGDWYLPAGYVEVDEDPARAVERETYEECGLQVNARRLQ